MSVSEYYDADIDSVSRFAGYYDAAHPDPDEEPPPHLVMHVVAPPLGDVVANLAMRLGEVEYRLEILAFLAGETKKMHADIEHIKNLLHRHLNRTEGEL